MQAGELELSEALRRQRLTEAQEQLGGEGGRAGGTEGGTEDGDDDEAAAKVYTLFFSCVVSVWVFLSRLLSWAAFV